MVRFAKFKRALISLGKGEAMTSNVPSLYEPINLYKPLAPGIGIVDGPFERLTVAGLRLPLKCGCGRSRTGCAALIQCNPTLREYSP